MGFLEEILGSGVIEGNPYYQGPTWQELLLRGLGSGIQQVGNQRSNTFGGALIRGGLGVLGGTMGALGEEMGARRSDPLARQMATRRDAMSAMDQVRIPESGFTFQPPPIESQSMATPEFSMPVAMPFAPPPMAQGAQMPFQPPPIKPQAPAAPTYGVVGSRAPTSLPEMLKYANDAQRSAIAAGFSPDMGKLSEGMFFEQPKYQSGEHSLVKIQGDTVTPIWGGKELSDAEKVDQEVRNFKNRQIVALQKNPEDQNAQNNLRLISEYGSSDAYNQLVHRLVRTKGLSLEDAIKQVEGMKGTAAGDKSELSRRGTLRADASPLASEAAANRAEGAKIGEARGVNSESFREAQRKLIAAKATAERANRDLTGPERQTFTRLNGISKALKVVAENWEPGFTGSMVAANRAMREGLDQEINNANRAATEGQPYVGGRMAARVREYLGVMSQKQATFYRGLADLWDRQLRARSESQTSEPEAYRLKDTVPNEGDSPSSFKAKFDSYVEEHAATMDTFATSVAESAVDSANRLRGTPRPRLGQPATKAPSPFTPPPPSSVTPSGPPTKMGDVGNVPPRAKTKEERLRSLFGE